MESYCDLHTHSTFSDGTLTPSRLLAAAHSAGLRAIALTDHNTVAGLPAFLEAAGEYSVEAIPGAEFSTDYRGTELHILALFIRPEHYDAVTARMEELVKAKDRCNRALVEALNRAGLELDYDAIKASTPKGQLNRAVIGARIAEAGYADSVQDAFDRYLSVKRGFYHPPERPEVLAVIRFIKSIGAVAVLAHPFLNLKTEDQLRGFLTEAVPAGLDAMETAYPLFGPEITRLAGKIAGEFGILPSGGSDFHGANKPDISLGTGKGNIRVPMEYLENMKKRLP